MDNNSSTEKKAPPPSANDTIDNITNQTKGLFDDMTSWMELKIQYIILDYQEQITQKVKGAAFEIGALAVLGVALLFGLVALALGVGSWLNHPAWGFLVVMGVLVVVALVARAIGKRISTPRGADKKEKHIDITEEKPKLPGPRIPEQLSTKNGES